MDLFNLAAKLSLDSKNFSDGLKKADKQGESFAKKLTKSFNTITKAAKTILGGVLVRTVTNSLKNIASATANFGDVIDKQSQTLGLSRKAYQEWDYVMSQSGGDINSLARSMRTMNNIIMAGADETKKAVREMGGDFDLLASLDREHQFDYLINMFQQMPDDAKRAQLAMKFFSFGAQEMAPLFNTSSAELYALREQAEKLGLYMSDEGVDASVAFNDAYDTMSRMFQSLKNDLVTSILPDLTEALGKITNWASELKKAYDEEGLVGIFEKLGSDIAAVFSKLWLTIRANLTWEKLKQVGTDIINKIKSGIDAGWSALVGFVSDLPGLVFGKKEDGSVNWPTWDSMKETALRLWNRLKRFVSSLGGLIFGKNSDGSVMLPTWADVKESAMRLWNRLKRLVGSLGGLVFGKNADGSVMLPTWSDVKESATRLWNRLKAFVSRLGGLVFGRNSDGSVILPTWSDVKETATRLWNRLKAFVSRLGGLVFGRNDDGSVILPTWADVKETALRLWNRLKAFVSRLGGLVFGKNADGSVILPPWDSVKEAASRLWNRLKAFAGRLGGLVFGKLSDIKINLPSWSEIKSGISTAWQDIVDFVAKLPELVFGKGSKITKGAQNLLTFIKDLGDWAIQHGDSAAIALGAVFAAIQIKNIASFISAKPTFLAIAGLVTLVATNYDSIKQGFGSMADAFTMIAGAVAGFMVVRKIKEATTAIQGLMGTLNGTGGLQEWLKGNKWELIFAGLSAVALLIYENWDKIEPVIEQIGGLINDYIISPITGLFDNLKEWIDELVASFTRVRQIGKIENWNNANADMLSLLQSNYDKYGTGGFIQQQLEAILQKNPEEMAEEFGISTKEAKEMLAALEAQIAEITGKNYQLTFEPVIVESGVSDKGATWNVYEDGSSGAGRAKNNAKGLWTVPYDDYLTRLHRGERVLSASQARHYDGGGASAGDIAAAVKAAVSEAMANLSITLDKKIVGKVMGDTVSSRVHDNINFANAQTAYSHGR